MTVAGFIRMGASGGRLLSALLVVALLVCHGVLGVLHQVPAGPHGAPGYGHHQAPVDGAGPERAAHPEERGGGHAVIHAEYAAVLSVVVLGMILGLLLRRAGRTYGRVMLQSDRCVPTLAAPHLLRGPTSTLRLQVFRL